MKKRLSLKGLPINEELEKLERSSLVEYALKGKILTREEAAEYFNKWIELLDSIPLTETSPNFGIRRIPSSKKAVISSRNSVMNYMILSGKQESEHLQGVVDRFNERIKFASSEDEVLYIDIFEASMYLNNDEGTWCPVISSVDFGFKNGIELAKVWTYDENANPVCGNYIYSWNEGLKAYIEEGKKWLDKYAPINEIPVISKD